MQNEYASTKIIKLFAIFTQVFLNWMFFTYNKYFIFKKMKHIFFLYLIMQFVIKFILHRYNIKIIRRWYRQSNLPTVAYSTLLELFALSIVDKKKPVFGLT